MTFKRLMAKATKAPLLREVLEPAWRLNVRRWRIETPAWGDRAPLCIGILSDLHFGFGRVNTELTEQAKRRLMATSPDILLFLGDISGGRTYAERVRNVAIGAEALHGLSAPLGTYAILGNHDWHDDWETQVSRKGPAAAASHLEAAGFHVLENAACRPGRDDVWLVGLASQQAFKGKRKHARRIGAHKLDRAMAAAPGTDPVILLAHEPDIFPKLADDRIVLTLSGHMHGGQIRPFGRAYYAPSEYGTRYAYGYHQTGARHLIVSGGIGCSTIPFRIGIVPEVTVVEISAPQ